LRLLRAADAALFRATDGDGDGRVTGQVAVALMSKSGLPREVLREVWVLADADRDGVREPEAPPARVAVAVAVRVCVCVSVCVCVGLTIPTRHTARTRLFASSAT
jgi:hypothetical protein